MRTAARRQGREARPSDLRGRFLLQLSLTLVAAALAMGREGLGGSCGSSCGSECIVGWWGRSRSASIASNRSSPSARHGAGARLMGTGTEGSSTSSASRSFIHQSIARQADGRWGSASGWGRSVGKSHKARGPEKGETGPWRGDGRDGGPHWNGLRLTMSRWYYVYEQNVTSAM